MAVCLQTPQWVWEQGKKCKTFHCFHPETIQRYGGEKYENSANSWGGEELDEVGTGDFQSA